MSEPSAKTPLLILGAGSFALETLDIAESAGIFQPLGFLVNLEPPAPGARHAGLPVYWADDLRLTPQECFLAAGIVSTRRRAFVEQMLARGFRFVSIVHQSAVISPRAHLGAGCVVHAGVIVSTNTVIEDHVILNRGSLIGHDNHLGAFTTLGPGANVAGAVEIGQGAYVGVGAVVRDHLEVGEGAVVGAGAVVVESVPAFEQPLCD